MDFEYTESQTLLIDMLRRFLQNEYTFATRDKLSKSALGHSRDIWRELASLGVIGSLFSEADGGYGGTPFDVVAVFECLGRGLVLEPFLNVLLTGRALAEAHHSDQRRWIAKMIEGESVIAFAHEESGAHYAMSHVETRARRQGSNWILDGVKNGVLLGESVDLYLVSGRSAGNVNAENGISLLLVPAMTPGISVRGFPTIDGGRSAEVTFTNVRVPAHAVVGEEGAAFATIEHAIGAAVLGLCAEALGAMEETKAATLDYLRTRKQFGHSIGTFQALQHRMATLLIEIEQARSSVINAAAVMDGDRVLRERALSAAKFSIGRIGSLVAEECIQLHGAIGMTWELPAAHFAKRLVMIDHQFGDEDFHLERYIEFGLGGRKAPDINESGTATME